MGERAHRPQCVADGHGVGKERGAFMSNWVQRTSTIVAQGRTPYKSEPARLLKRKRLAGLTGQRRKKELGRFRQSCGQQQFGLAPPGAA